jgi:hypothetical protein
MRKSRTAIGLVLGLAFASSVPGAAGRRIDGHGYRIPEGMTRVRLVHVPEKNRREELMIIYAEVPAPGSSPEVAEATALRNATKWLHIGIER